MFYIAMQADLISVSWSMRFHQVSRHASADGAGIQQGGGCALRDGKHVAQGGDGPPAPLATSGAEWKLTVAHNRYIE